MWNAVAKSGWQHCDKHCEKFSTCKFYLCCIAFCTCIACYSVQYFCLDNWIQSRKSAIRFSHWAKRQIESKLSTQMLNAFDVKSFLVVIHFCSMFHLVLIFGCVTHVVKKITHLRQCVYWKKKLVWKMRTIFLKNHLKWRKFSMKKMCWPGSNCINCERSPWYSIIGFGRWYLHVNRIKFVFSFSYNFEKSWTRVFFYLN